MGLERQRSLLTTDGDCEEAALHPRRSADRCKLFIQEFTLEQFHFLLGMIKVLNEIKSNPAEEGGWSLVERLTPPNKTS